MGKQHRFVEHMPTRGETQGVEFRGDGWTTDRIAFWIGVVAGAAAGLAVLADWAVRHL